MAKKSLLAGLALFALSGCELMLTAAEDPVLIKLNELERRLQSIERIVENQSLVQMTQQVESLERRTDQLRGRAETLEHDAADTAGRQRQLYSDLDARIASLESSVRVGAATGALDAGSPLSVGQSQLASGSDRYNYQVAFELLKEERYDRSAAAFRQFLAAFPDSDLAGNAQYWLAESYYAADEFGRALQDFELVVSDYPRSRKVPDALLKMGYCNYSLKRWNAARVTLSQVQAEYPETTAARLAGQYLERMDSEGV
ncbi:MAG: tol-pal system protein YbgF [Proteobacteria bacterium]|nr:tol-pal system protein YbgF [Pseudomonadota bacterium]